MKKLVAIMMSAFMLVALCSCGGAEANPEFAGTYYCTEEIMSGQSIGTENEWIELVEDGSGTLYYGDLMEMTVDISWTTDGNKITVVDEEYDDKYTGEISDGIITLEMMTIEYTFTLDGGETEPVDSSGESVDDTSPVSSEDIAGKYVCTAASCAGEENATDNEWIELSTDGTGSLYLGDFIGETYSITWELNGSEFTLFNIDWEDQSVGTYSDGVIEINIGDVDYVFTGEGSAAESGSDAEETSETTVDDFTATDPVSYWDRDWYGYWITDYGTGTYDYINDSSPVWYDCCATIALENGESGHLEIWDENGSIDLVMVKLDFTIGAGVTESGCLTSESGLFYDCPIEHADWIVDPGASDVSQYDHMICIDGEYIDPNNSDNTYTYNIYLRPFGMLWDDVDGEEVRVPYYYEDWYLLSLDNNIGMTDTIDPYAAHDVIDGVVVDETEPAGTEDNSDSGNLPVQTETLTADQLFDAYDWVTELNHDITLSDGEDIITYEYVVDYIGCDGTQDPNYTGDVTSYIWTADTGELLQINFQLNSEGNITYAGSSCSSRN